MRRQVRGGQMSSGTKAELRVVYAKAKHHACPSRTSQHAVLLRNGSLCARCAESSKRFRRVGRPGVVQDLPNTEAGSVAGNQLLCNDRHFHRWQRGGGEKTRRGREHWKHQPAEVSTSSPSTVRFARGLTRCSALLSTLGTSRHPNFGQPSAVRYRYGLWYTIRSSLAHCVSLLDAQSPIGEQLHNRRILISHNGPWRFISSRTKVDVEKLLTARANLLSTVTADPYSPTLYTISAGAYYSPEYEPRHPRLQDHMINWPPAAARPEARHRLPSRLSLFQLANSENASWQRSCEVPPFSILASIQITTLGLGSTNKQQLVCAIHRPSKTNPPIQATPQPGVLSIEKRWRNIAPFPRKRRCPP
ncbi:hypothetical protein P153DRAFT_392679, partial [Dothidotthia symphoricarpi CBS 119687]